jgi:membrane protein
MTTKTKKTIFFIIAIIVIIVSGSLIGHHVYTQAEARIPYIVTAEDGVRAKRTMGKSSQTITVHRKGEILKFDSIIDNAWGVHTANFRTTYVPLNGVALCKPSDGQRPGPGQHYTPVTDAEFAYTWSTNRIIEHMPDFGVLRGKAGNADVWFWVGGFLLLITVLYGFWVGSDLSFNTWEFYFIGIMLMAVSVCQVVYLTSSEEPLAFFSPDNVGWWQAIIRFIAVFVALQLQLSLFVYLLEKIEKESKKGFLSDWVSYFIWGGSLVSVGIFVFGIFEEKPEPWYWYIAVAIIIIPVIALIISAIRGREVGPQLIALLLYIVCGGALMVSLSVMLIVLVSILIAYLLVRTAMMFLGEGSLEQDANGVYHYVFPDGSTSLFDSFSW